MFFFFFNDTATTEIYTLSLHDALPISFKDRTFDNPFWTTYQHLNASSVGRVYGNLNGEYLPMPWLKINYTLGADYATDERLEGCPSSTSAPCIRGRVVEGKIINYTIDHNLTATATYTLTP